MERYYVNRWERVLDLRVIKEVTATTRVVDGSLQSIEENEVTWKVATMETDYATYELSYKGKAIRVEASPTYFGPKAAVLAVDDAKQFCRLYEVEHPLTVSVYSWTERVECKAHFDDEIWHRTEKPVEESRKVRVWSSAEGL